MAIRDLLRDLQKRLVAPRKRGLSIVGDRVYVETRGISHIDLPRFSRALAERAELVPWVRTAHLEPFTRRAVLVIEGPMRPDEEITAVVAEVEAGLSHLAQASRHETERDLPDDLELERERAIETAADAVALVVVPACACCRSSRAGSAATCTPFCS